LIRVAAMDLFDQHFLSFINHPATLINLFLPIVLIIAIYSSPKMKVLKKLQSVATRMSFGEEPKLASSLDFFSLEDKLIDGTPVTMDRFKGDVLCIVNVASK
jgi:hypothetical protein